MGSKIGDKSEHIVIRELLKITKHAEKVPYNEHNYDVVYELEDGKRGIQVKTLGKKNTRTNTYGINHIDRYDIELLLIAVNEEDNLAFVCILNKDLTPPKQHSITITNKKGTKYYKYLVPLNKLESKLREYIRVLPVIKGWTYTSMQIKEIDMTERFISFCEKKGLKAHKHDSEGDAVDVFVEGKRCQLKYSSKPQNTNRTFAYKISMVRRVGNKKKVPYKEGEVDYYIIELGCNHGKFLILPESFLIKKGVIKTKEQKGKEGMGIYPEGYKRSNGKMGPRINGNWSNKCGLWYDDNREWII